MKREINMRYVHKDTKADGKESCDKVYCKGADMSGDRINTDPLGMWTGVPTGEQYEEPVQDADDL